MDDTLIIELFLLRDEEAIRQCQKKYSPYCRFIISNVLSDEEDLKEVLSDVFLKAWNTIPSSPPKSLKSYLGMLCRQLSHFDRHARHGLGRRAVISLGRGWLSRDLYPR